MIIHTVQDWNEILLGCDCCLMPVCPVVALSPQSRLRFHEDGHAPDAYNSWDTYGYSSAQNVSTQGGWWEIQLRVHFQVPADWTGSYFRLDFDLVTTLENQSPTLDDGHSIEWTGPGQGDQDDPSWFSEWFYINAPATTGVIELANQRFICYKSAKTGVAPQVTGPTFENGEWGEGP